MHRTMAPSAVNWFRWRNRAWAAALLLIIARNASVAAKVPDIGEWWAAFLVVASLGGADLLRGKPVYSWIVLPAIALVSCGAGPYSTLKLSIDKTGDGGPSIEVKAAIGEDADVVQSLPYQTFIWLLPFLDEPPVQCEASDSAGPLSTKLDKLGRGRYACVVTRNDRAEVTPAEVSPSRVPTCVRHDAGNRCVSYEFGIRKTDVLENGEIFDLALDLPAESDVRSAISFQHSVEDLPADAVRSPIALAVLTTPAAHHKKDAKLGASAPVTIFDQLGAVAESPGEARVGVRLVVRDLVPGAIVMIRDLRVRVDSVAPKQKTARRHQR